MHDGLCQKKKKNTGDWAVLSLVPGIVIEVSVQELSCTQIPKPRGMMRILFEAVNSCSISGTDTEENIS